MANSQQTRSLLHLSDEELEYYGDLYVHCAISEAGVEFETFLGNPDYYLRKHARGKPAFSGRDGARRKGLLRYLWFRQGNRSSPD